MKDESVPLPPSDPGQSRDEIAAEIADHLAAAEAELTQRGATVEEAKASARKRFGDVEKIRTTCYWIQNGETIMLRWTFATLAAIVCILLGLSVLGNWRTQSQLADEMGKLSAELKAMAAAKQAPPPVPQPPEITGVIYAGSKDKPLGGARVAIRRADGTVVRRTTSDAKGDFRSGPLESGDYCVTSSVANAPPGLADWAVQSEPIFLHSGSGNVVLFLDAAYHGGGIKIVANRPLPDVVKDGKYLIKSRLEVVARSPRRRDSIWTPADDSPEAWPIYFERSLILDEKRSFIKATDVSLVLDANRTAELKEGKKLMPAMFPTGKTEISIMLSNTVLPLDMNGNVVLLSNYLGSLPRAREDIPNYHLKPTQSVPWSKLDDDLAWRVISRGMPWMDHLDASKSNIYHGGTSLPRPEIEIQEGSVATLHVVIPEGIEAELQKAVEESKDIQQFTEWVHRQGLLQRSLKITATSFEPIPK